MTRNTENFATILLRKAYTLATMLMNDNATSLASLEKYEEDGAAMEAILCCLNIAKSCYKMCALNLEQIAIRKGVADDRFYNDNRGIALDCDSCDNLYSAMNILLEETDDKDSRDYLVENVRMLDFLRG